MVISKLFAFTVSVGATGVLEGGKTFIEHLYWLCTGEHYEQTQNIIDKLYKRDHVCQSAAFTYASFRTHIEY